MDEIEPFFEDEDDLLPETPVAKAAEQKKNALNAYQQKLVEKMNEAVPPASVYAAGGVVQGPKGDTGIVYTKIAAGTTITPGTLAQNPNTVGHGPYAYPTTSNTVNVNTPIKYSDTELRVLALEKALDGDVDINQVVPLAQTFYDFLSNADTDKAAGWDE